MLLVACDHHFGQVSYKRYTRRQVRRNPQASSSKASPWSPRRRKHKSVTRESQVDSGGRIRGGSLSRADLTVASGVFSLSVERGALERSRGRPPEANCNVVNGIPRRLRRIGALLRDVPGECGEWNSIYRPLRQWSASGVWGSVAIALHGRQPSAGTIKSTAHCSHHHSSHQYLCNRRNGDS
jgi:transposase